jgi:LAS superfamily LD-carboxypeptidase LdcB
MTRIPILVALVLSACSHTDPTGAIPTAAPLSPFDSRNPAITRLDPALEHALRGAAVAARADGVELRVSGGWRSAAHQQQLLDDAIENYGSEAVARRYVATPATSAHVQGKAADVAPTAADSWLMQHGSTYGLCQTYANERWHFERAVRPGGTCPAPRPDASG